MWLRVLPFGLQLSVHLRLYAVVHDTAQPNNLLVAQWLTCHHKCSLQMLWNTVLCQIATSKPPTEVTERADEVLKEGTNVVPQ
jgi:hypothetical protein